MRQYELQPYTGGIPINIDTFTQGWSSLHYADVDPPKAQVHHYFILPCSLALCGLVILVHVEVILVRVVIGDTY